MYLVVSVISMLLFIGALIDIIIRPSDQVRYLPKVVWVLIVIFLPFIGSILWFALGREYSAAPRLGTIMLPRRDATAPEPFEWRAGAGAGRVPRTTEEELAALDREIELHDQAERIKRLEAELDKRRSTGD
ncbi:PLD nuclease N-terminal domain-containing protein [Glaciibacter psychrotolerans]|uniref:Cardiolipin synthase N-terminal domain-containing protein n=1 Tax=Glaciibacter psychrotolerans TaxID=670054 RepID=A0A7Z0J6D8_9MICO|nr:PLD nuclease N-terminal domain-containing protein [Leifsonia psychrotolerans]NYJ20121.1 hypothetical protein [Leifsonia psychrotolerans]